MHVVLKGLIIASCIALAFYLLCVLMTYMRKYWYKEMLKNLRKHIEEAVIEEVNSEKHIKIQIDRSIEKQILEYCNKCISKDPAANTIIDKTEDEKRLKYVVLLKCVIQKNSIFYNVKNY